MEKASDIDVLNQLFTNYRNGFIRFAYSYVRDQFVAEDFTVESLMVFWENRQKLDPAINPPAYVLTVLKNKCLNYLQHLQVRQNVTELLMDSARQELNIRISTLEACDPNELFSAEIQEIVQQTLLQLPEKTRLIFKMSREENLTNAQIAEQMDLSKKSIEAHITRALQALRSALKEYGMSVLIFYL